jgi:queuine tRNA-ribosyltransferase catalytic subunit
MGSARTAIVEDRFPDFLKIYFRRHFNGTENVPQWVTDALGSVGVDLA